MTLLHWSTNVDNPPLLLAPEEVRERDRAYPYAETPDPTTDDQPYIRITPHEVTFIGQRGPIKEVGVNGCQIDDLITFALGTLQTFQKKWPCRENALAITKLEESLHWLDARRRDRETRRVEGRDQP